MQDTTPKLISSAEFNQQVRGWTIRTKQRMISNAPKFSGTESPKRTSEKLAGSIINQFKNNFDHISIIRFKFARHGVFVHYGVGRGYTRKGNTVIRKPRKDGTVGTGFNRQPDDWYDVEIRSGLLELAEISQDYYGDWALQDLLSKMEKFTIQRK